MHSLKQKLIGKPSDFTQQEGSGFDKFNLSFKSKDFLSLLERAQSTKKAIQNINEVSEQVLDYKINEVSGANIVNASQEFLG